MDASGTVIGGWDGVATTHLVPRRYMSTGRRLLRSCQDEGHAAQWLFIWVYPLQPGIARENRKGRERGDVSLPALPATTPFARHVRHGWFGSPCCFGSSPAR